MSYTQNLWIFFVLVLSIIIARCLWAGLHHLRNEPQSLHVHARRLTAFHEPRYGLVRAQAIAFGLIAIIGAGRFIEAWGWLRRRGGWGWDEDNSAETQIVIKLPWQLRARAISARIVKRKALMSGREMRFLRSEMGMTQAELAEMIHREPLTISRWERGETEIDANAETLIRLHAIERLNLEVVDGVSEISGWSIPSAIQSPIIIDGSDPANYHLAA